MFNFTTQTVYNQISTTGANKNLYVAANGKKPAIRVGNTRFDADSILDIQVKNPTEENLASVTFDLSKILIPQNSTDNEITARIVLYIGLSMNSQDAFYANNFVYKGKPLFIEFPVKKTDTVDLLAKRVKNIADKYLLIMMGTEKILEVTENKFTQTEISAAQEGDAAYGKTAGDSKGTVTFTGVNGYQQIKKAILQKFDPEAKTIDCCSKQGEYIDVVTGVPVVYTTNADGVVTASNNKIDADGNTVALEENEVAIIPGLEAFGDYNWIIHNLRLPTAANYYPWSPANRMGEMPIPGQSYTQIIIRMLKERDGIMGEIVGARGTSVTTHVLYVAGKPTVAGAAKTVLDAFKALNGVTAKIKTDADTALQTPYGN